MTTRRDVHRAVDGELSKRDTRKLQADPRAKEELNKLKAVSDTARHVVKPIQTPQGFKKKVLDELRRHHPPTGR